MNFRFKRQSYVGIIFIMISIFFFSCASSHKPISSASKHHNPYDEYKFKGLYYNGLKQKILGNYDDAMNFFRECLSLDPANPAANYEISQILEYNKHSDSSLVYIYRAVNGDPDNIWYRYYYAQNLQELGRYKEVVKVYEDLVKMHPGTTDLYYKLALAQLQAEEYKQAVETYNMLEQKMGRVDEEISMNKIEVLEKIKEYTQAEDEIQKLIKNSPSTPQYYDMLGNLYTLEGKNDKAFEVYQKMEKEYPHDPMVHLSLADYYKTANRDIDAYNELKMAFDEPALDIDTKIRIILGLNTFTKSDSIFDEAMTLTRKMVQANPTEPRGHAIYAGLLASPSVRDLNQARTEYRIAISEDSSKYTYWNQLLELDTQLNDLQGLADDSKAAIGLFPNGAQLYYYNGVANMQLKNYEGALNAFKSGVFYVLGDSNMLEKFYTYMGDVSYYSKRFSTSDSAYEQALKINPNDDYVLNNYSYYLSVRDTDLEKAAQMSKKSNELVQNNASYEDTYGWILYISHKYTDAKEWESKAIEHGGDRDATILEHYGDILFKLSEKDSAVDYWAKAKQAGANSDLLNKKIKDKQLYEK